MRVESLEIGVSGIVRLRTDGGSLFLFRTEYLPESAGPIPASGDEASPLFLEGAEEASASYAAEAKAMDLLARTEHSRYLLALKLKKRGMDGPAIRRALDRLESRGYLDDSRYARAWAEERTRRRGEGPARIAAGLAARGVGEELIRRVCGEIFGGEARREALGRAARRMLRSARGDEAAVERKLLREGWRPSEIRAALEALRNEGD